jgi:hypothetical protein
MMPAHDLMEPVKCLHEAEQVLVEQGTELY